MRTKYEQISSCVVLLSPYRQNFNLAYTTTSVIIVASIYFVTAYASLYTYFALAFKRICLSTCKDPSLHSGTIRHNDVASFCTLTHRKPIKPITTYGILSTATGAVHHSVRRVAHRLGGRPLSGAKQSSGHLHRVTIALLRWQRLQQSKYNGIYSRRFGFVVGMASKVV